MLALVVVNVVGALRAVRLGRPARFGAIRLPGTAGQHALTVGSAMSAPPAMLAALVVAAERRQRPVVAGLAALMVVGVLGEPDTWRTLRAPGRDPIAISVAIAEIALPAAIVGSAATGRRTVLPAPVRG